MNRNSLSQNQANLFNQGFANLHQNRQSFGNIVRPQNFNPVKESVNQRNSSPSQIAHQNGFQMANYGSQMAFNRSPQHNQFMRMTNQIPFPSARDSVQKRQKSFSIQPIHMEPHNASGNYHNLSSSPYSRTQMMPNRIGLSSDFAILAGMTDLEAIAEKSRIRNEIINLRNFKKDAIDLLIEQQVNIENIVHDYELLSTLKTTSSKSGETVDSLGVGEKGIEAQDSLLEQSEGSNLGKNIYINRAKETFERVFNFLQTYIQPIDQEISQSPPHANVDQDKESQHLSSQPKRSGFKTLDVSNGTITDNRKTPFDQEGFVSPSAQVFDFDSHRRPTPQFQTMPRIGGQRFANDQNADSDNAYQLTYFNPDQEFEDDSLDDEDDYDSEDEDEDLEVYQPSRGLKQTKASRIRKPLKKTKAISKMKKTLLVNPKSKKQFMRRDKLSKKKEQFECANCGEVFSSGWALGGHASRVHPGQSDSYKRKIATRAKRKQERLILMLAKEKHDDNFGENVILNRVKIRKFKKEIRRQFQTGQLRLSQFQIPDV